MTEVTLMLRWFYRAAQILSTFCPVRVVTCATSSDCAYHVDNMKVEKDLDMEGEEKVNVKTEKDIQ